MVPHRLRVGLFGCALALALLLLGRHRARAPAMREVPAARDGGAATGPARGFPGAPDAATPPRERSSLADRLNAPAGDVHADLRLVNEIFIAYRGATRMENPVGENREITSSLAGRNKLGYAFLPDDSAAINAQRELCDRWGTPYFFHQLSGQRMEIRSAGPDRKLWTPDDEVLTP